MAKLCQIFRIKKSNLHKDKQAKHVSVILSSNLVINLLEHYHRARFNGSPALSSQLSRKPGYLDVNNHQVALGGIVGPVAESVQGRSELRLVEVS